MRKILTGWVSILDHEKVMEQAKRGNYVSQVRIDYAPMAMVMRNNLRLPATGQYLGLMEVISDKISKVGKPYSLVAPLRLLRMPVNEPTLFLRLMKDLLHVYKEPAVSATNLDKPVESGKPEKPNGYKYMFGPNSVAAYQTLMAFYVMVRKSAKESNSEVTNCIRGDLAMAIEGLIYEDATRISEDKINTAGTLLGYAVKDWLIDCLMAIRGEDIAKFNALENTLYSSMSGLKCEGSFEVIGDVYPSNSINKDSIVPIRYANGALGDMALMRAVSKYQLNCKNVTGFMSKVKNEYILNVNQKYIVDFDKYVELLESKVMQALRSMEWQNVMLSLVKDGITWQNSKYTPPVSALRRNRQKNSPEQKGSLQENSKVSKENQVPTDTQRDAESENKPRKSRNKGHTTQLSREVSEKLQNGAVTTEDYQALYSEAISRLQGATQALIAEDLDTAEVWPEDKLIGYFEKIRDRELTLGACVTSLITDLEASDKALAYIKAVPEENSKPNSSKLHRKLRNALEPYYRVCVVLWELNPQVDSKCEQNSEQTEHKSEQETVQQPEQETEQETEQKLEQEEATEEQTEQKPEQETEAESSN